MVTLEAAPRFAPHCFIRFGMMTFEGLIPSSRATYTSGMVTTILALARPSSSLAIASAMRSKALSRIGLSSPASTTRASSDRSAPTLKLNVSYVDDVPPNKERLALRSEFKASVTRRVTMKRTRSHLRQQLD